MNIYLKKRITYSLTVVLLSMALTGCVVGKIAAEIAEALAKHSDDVVSQVTKKADIPKKSTLKDEVISSDGVKDGSLDDLDILKLDLVTKIPSKVANAIRSKNKSNNKFKLIPYEATYSGLITIDDKRESVDMKIVVSQQNCKWTQIADLSWTDYEQRFVLSLRESQFGTGEKTNAKLSITYVDSDTNIEDISTEEIIYEIEKFSGDGFKVSFVSPVRDSFVSNKNAKLEFETLRFILDMIRKNNYKFSYDSIDVDAKKMTVANDITIVPINDLIEGVTVYSQDIVSRMDNDGSKPYLSYSREIIDSHGVALYFFIEDSEFFIDDVSFLDSGACH